MLESNSSADIGEGVMVDWAGSPGSAQRIRFIIILSIKR